MDFIILSYAQSNNRGAMLKSTNAPVLLLFLLLQVITFLVGERGGRRHFSFEKTSHTTGEIQLDNEGQPKPLCTTETRIF